MEEFKKILEGIQKSVESLEKRVDSIQKAGEVSASGAKSPGDRSLPSPLIPVEDEVSPVVSWADRMELESEPLTSSGDEVRPVKIRDESELVLHKAFTPLKNPDRRALRRQFVVPDLPITMAPKLDKVMAAECLPTVRSTDQSLARLQALMLDAVGPLTDLMERMAGTPEEEDQGIDLQVVEDAVHSALAFLGNAATQFSTYRRTKILEEYNKDLVSFSEEMEPDLRAAAPLLFGSSFTKQAADHLSQVEALRKVKGKNKKVFSRPPLQRQARWQGGSKPYHRGFGGKTPAATPKKQQK